TQVGYQPVGTNPYDLDEPGFETLKTARQLLSALAMYNVLSSADKATLLVVLPAGASGKRLAESVSITFCFLVSITETLLLFAFATNRKFPFLVKVISFGWLSVAIESEITPFFTS